jgi:hypothetical protein
MNASFLAQEIWADLWEFGRVLLIMVCGLGWQSFRFGRLRDREELFDSANVILIGLCSVGVFCIFLFLNIQMSNILKLIKVAPLWGAFSSVSFVGIVAISGLIAHQQLGTTRDEMNLSVLNTTEPSSSWMSPKLLLIGLCVSTLSGLLAAWWLWSIAHGRWIA